MTPEKYSYTFENEGALANSIRYGQTQTALRLIERMFDSNVRGPGNTSVKLRCFFYDLLGTLYKLAPPNELFKVHALSVDTLLRARGIDELCALIREAVIELSERNIRVAASSLRIKQVIEYVNENYTSNALSQTNVAKQFGITTAYLSRAFKESTGLNMVDYINRRRVERVKQLIREAYEKREQTPEAYMLSGGSRPSDESVPLTKIAQEVGYLSDLALIRIFKRYEGMTPKQWLTLL